MSVYDYKKSDGTKPRSYLDDVVIKPQPELNDDHRHCPRCGHYGGKLIKDYSDAFCINCGFRLSAFNIKDPAKIDRDYNTSLFFTRLVYNRPGALDDTHAIEFPGRGRERIRGFIMLTRCK